MEQTTIVRNYLDKELTFYHRDIDIDRRMIKGGFPKSPTAGENFRMIPVEVYNDIDVILDVGAYIGTYALKMISQYNIPVVAVEADLENYGLLVKNVKENHFDELEPFVECVYVAISDVYGTMDFYNGKSPTTNTLIKKKVKRESTSVKTVPLNDFLDVEEGNNIFVKMDIEGGEAITFRNFKDWHKIHTLLVEWHFWHLKNSLDPDETIYNNFIADLEENYETVITTRTKKNDWTDRIVATGYKGK